MANPEMQNPIIKIIEQYPATSSIVSASVFFVLGQLLESKLKVIGKIKNKVKISNKIVDESKTSQSQGINNSPESLLGNAGNDVVSSTGIGNTVLKIENCPNAEITIGRQEDALGNPKITSVKQEELRFIYNQIKIRFGQIFSEDDYANAENYRVSGCFRPAATLYIRIFTPIVESLKRDEVELSLELSQEIEKLQMWSLEGSSSEKLDSIVGRAETIVYKLLQKS